MQDSSYCCYCKTYGQLFCQLNAICYPAVGGGAAAAAVFVLTLLLSLLPVWVLTTSLAVSLSRACKQQANTTAQVDKASFLGSRSTAGVDGLQLCKTVAFDAKHRGTKYHVADDAR
jgi:hypothetical protein